MFRCLGAGSYKVIASRRRIVNDFLKHQGETP
jgi:hypothetical protein